jgi:hypothetical protein
MLTNPKETLDLLGQSEYEVVISWDEVDELFLALGAEISYAEGERVCFRLYDQRLVFHRELATCNPDGGSVASMQAFFKEHGLLF